MESIGNLLAALILYAYLYLIVWPQAWIRDGDYIAPVMVIVGSYVAVLLFVFVKQSYRRIFALYSNEPTPSAIDCFRITARRIIAVWLVAALFTGLFDPRLRVGPEPFGPTRIPTKP